MNLGIEPMSSAYQPNALLLGHTGSLGGGGGGSSVYLI